MASPPAEIRRIPTAAEQYNPALLVRNEMKSGLLSTRYRLRISRRSDNSSRYRTPRNRPAVIHRVAGDSLDIR